MGRRELRTFLFILLNFDFILFILIFLFFQYCSPALCRSTCLAGPRQSSVRPFSHYRIPVYIPLVLKYPFIIYMSSSNQTSVVHPTQFVVPIYPENLSIS